jgi:hypothetical protein
VNYIRRTGLYLFYTSVCYPDLAVRASRACFHMRNALQVFHHIDTIIPERLICVQQAEPLYRCFHLVVVLALLRHRGFPRPRSAWLSGQCMSAKIMCRRFQKNSIRGYLKLVEVNFRPLNLQKVKKHMIKAFAQRPSIIS